MKYIVPLKSLSDGTTTTALCVYVLVLPALYLGYTQKVRMVDKIGESLQLLAYVGNVTMC